jgi:hypothetical protein
LFADVAQAELRGYQGGREQGRGDEGVNSGHGGTAQPRNYAGCISSASCASCSA